MRPDCQLFLLEDNGDDIFFLQKALAEVGIGVGCTIVRDGQEALDYLSGKGVYDNRRQYPLPTHAILDLKVPRKSGVEVLAWLRQRPEYQSLPVMVFTSSPDRSDIERCRALRIEAYLVKPVAYDRLVVMVSAVAQYWRTGERELLTALEVR